MFALLVTGCSQATTNAASSPTQSPAPASTASQSATPSSTRYIADDPTVYLLGGDSTYAWISPSRNIACGIEPTYYLNSNDHTQWGCEVNQHTWKTPSKNPGDFCYNAQIPCGTGVGAVDNQTPIPSMHGDERYPSEEALYGNTTPIALATKTLQYGHSITVGTITCTSLATGMTCNDTDGGHGFTVSRSVYLSH
jgi:hypothetical protein